MDKNLEGASIEWCVSDLDGTLLNSKGEVSPQTQEAIAQLHEAGIGFTLATGRNDLHIREMIQNLKITLPVISCNGALIRDMATENVIQADYIEDGAVDRIIEVGSHYGWDFIGYTKDAIWYLPDSPGMKYYREYNRKSDPAFHIPLNGTSTAEWPREEFLKFFIWDVPAGQAKELEQEERITRVQSMAGSLDIMAAGVSKGRGLKILADHLGMDLARTAVFGDNHNDLEMLSAAGYSFAMSNGEEETKRTAKYSTGTNDEHGVAQIILSKIL